MDISKAITLAVAVIPALLMYWKKKKHKEVLTELQKTTDKTWYNFLFVTNENSECVDHLRQELPCGENCSHKYLEDIKQHIRSAKTSISVCMYHITLRSILDELSEAYNRQVQIRVISDREMAHHSSSIIRELIEIGIPVKVQPDTSSLMHHKFFLIDENTENKEVWFGSLNLTAQGLTTNWDNVVYTNNSSIIIDFSKCFEMLWKSFSEYV